MTARPPVSRRSALKGAALLGAGLLSAQGTSVHAQQSSMQKGRTGRAPIDGLDVYFEVHGAGLAPHTIPLVLFHGGSVPVEIAFSRQLIRRLTRNQPVVLIEQQGHGHTADRPDAPMSIERMVRDSVGVLSYLGISKADLLGHSMGGMIATGISIRHPDRVNSVTTLGTPYQLEGFRPDLVSLQKGLTATPSPELAKLLPTDAEFSAWRESFRRNAPDPDAFDAILERLNVMLGSWPGWTREQLQAISVPTLIVVGDNDYVRVEHAAEVSRLIPKAHMAVLPDTTHLDIVKRDDWLELIVQAARRPVL